MFCRQILKLDVKSLGAELVAADISGLSGAGRGSLLFLADSSHLVDFPLGIMFGGAWGVVGGASGTFFGDFL